MSAEETGPDGRWATQQEAAQALGISTEAVRMRVRRGSLSSGKDDQGRVVVWLVEDRTQSARESAHETARGTDSALVESLEARIESLERSLEHERESSRRKDHIIAGLVQRVPELPEAQEPSEESTQHAPEAEPSEDTQQREDRNEPRGSAQRPWWRRWLGR